MTRLLNGSSATDLSSQSVDQAVADVTATRGGALSVELGNFGEGGAMSQLYGEYGVQPGEMLSASPLDYLTSRQEFDKKKHDVKKHLGTEAFDNGDPFYKGKVPKFRYEAEWLILQAAPERQLVKPVILSPISRGEWKNWVEGNSKVAMSFISEMRDNGVALDFSAESIDKLDSYLEKSGLNITVPPIDLVMKIAAYASQMTVKQTGAKWSFTKSEDVPSLKIGGIRVTPVARVLKALEEREKIGPWYRFILDELIPSVGSKYGNGPGPQDTR